MPGAETIAAIRAYQASHPDLVVDGIAGPATRASLDRDLAGRRHVGGPAAVGTAGTLLAVIASMFGGGKGMLAAAVGIATLSLAARALLRHQADLGRLFRFLRG